MLALQGFSLNRRFVWIVVIFTTSYPIESDFLALLTLVPLRDSAAENGSWYCDLISL